MLCGVIVLMKRNEKEDRFLGERFAKLKEDETKNYFDGKQKTLNPRLSKHFPVFIEKQ